MEHEGGERVWGPASRGAGRLLDCGCCGWLFVWGKDTVFFVRTSYLFWAGLVENPPDGQARVSVGLGQVHFFHSLGFWLEAVKRLGKVIASSLGGECNVVDFCTFFFVVFFWGGAIIRATGGGAGTL